MGQWFSMKRGVKQGDVIAPLLFNVAIDRIIREVESRRGGGLQCGDMELRSLAFADDLTVGVRNEEEVEWLKECLEHYSGPSGLSVNVKKTVVLWRKDMGVPASPGDEPWRSVSCAAVLG